MKNGKTKKKNKEIHDRLDNLKTNTKMYLEIRFNIEFELYKRPLLK